VARMGWLAVASSYFLCPVCVLNVRHHHHHRRRHDRRQVKSPVYFGTHLVGYSCPMRHVPTYILHAKEIRLLGRFHPDSFKTERLVCVETDRRTWLDRLL